MKRMTYGTIEEIRTKFDVDLLKLLEEDSVFEKFSELKTTLPILEYFFEEDFKNNPDVDFDYISKKTIAFINELARFFPTDQAQLLRLVTGEIEAIKTNYTGAVEAMGNLLRKISEDSISS